MLVNPLCDQNIAIDSAFVDKYCDLGSDVITLFADNTVYQLTVNTTDPINPVFVYNRSQSVDEWSEGIVGPIYMVITALIITFITYKLWTRSAPKGYRRYKTKPKPGDYVIISSDTQSGNKSLNGSQSRDPKASMSLSSLKDKRPTDLKVKSNEGSVKTL
ncbi:unnamed protein product [Medioppia subpectinata]|uniref:Uncharacterized protein n=1 Tax=Medioppia subpectinata TaxID=1979941 RepID=A0A7R9L2R0_9ACAR|nr:unnamed protein product [Medioppia subpectinata]CAG2114200.1 unnamed protein product [Medioppia subpectinata]